MSRIQSIALGTLPQVFESCGFDRNEMVAVLLVLMPYWLYNDETYDVTAEFIRSELDLEPFAVQTMLSEGLRQLEAMGQLVRQAFLTGRILRWNVLSYIILVELEDETNLFPLCVSATAH